MHSVGITMVICQQNNYFFFISASMNYQSDVKSWNDIKLPTWKMHDVPDNTSRDVCRLTWLQDKTWKCTLCPVKKENRAFADKFHAWDTCIIFVKM